MSRLRIAALLVVAAAALPPLAQPAAAIASNSHPTLAEIEEDVMCTVCGVPLSLAREAPAAKRERALINELIAQGKTKQQIEDTLVTTYGEEVLATPRTKGFDLWAWLIPGVLIVLAIIGLGYLLRRWRREPDEGGRSDESEPRP